MKINHAIEQRMGQRKKIKREIRKYLETNEDGNVTYQNLWEAAKAVPRGKFIVINDDLMKQKFQVNNLTLHFKALEKEEEIKPKV